MQNSNYVQIFSIELFLLYLLPALSSPALVTLDQLSQIVCLFGQAHELVLEQVTSRRPLVKAPLVLANAG